MKAVYANGPGGAITPGSLDKSLPARVNAGDETIYRNMDHALTLPNEWLVGSREPREDVAAIVAGGPSVAHDLDKIKQLYRDKQTIFAVNGAIKWLNSNGVVPTYGVMLDARPENIKFLKGASAKRWMISAQCDPSVFEYLPTKKTTIWWPNYEETRKRVKDRPAALIGGGTTVGLQSISIAYSMGFREIHVFGFDSSHTDEQHHAYDQPIPPDAEARSFAIRGRQFLAEPWMVRQAVEFQEVAHQLSIAGVYLAVHGDGLLPEVFKAQIEDKSEQSLIAVYDLACSPPQYDFFSFLLSAEKHRIEKGYKSIDVVFQPGPNEGFRHDNLPPDAATRRNMLWRIPVAVCRNLPSVRNVAVLKERQAFNGPVFPEAWSEACPWAWYGINHIVEGLPMALEGKSGNPFPGAKYVTITLREASYWPERNSDRGEWAIVARRLYKAGYKVVVVPDTENMEDRSRFPVDVEWYPVAAVDIDMRISLYQNAVCNLFVSNGPVDCARLSGAPHLVFKMITPECPSTTEEFLSHWGLNVGDQLPYNGRFEWGREEKADDICAAFDDFIASSQKGNENAA